MQPFINLVITRYLFAGIVLCSLSVSVLSFTSSRGTTKKDGVTNLRKSSFGLPSSSGSSSSSSLAVSTTTISSADALEDLGLPFGLRETFLRNAHTFSKRIWVLDNSGSMCMHDGRQVLLDKGCTRWGEVEETVNCHAQLSAAIGAPTDFRLLNSPTKGGPQTFRVGYGRQAAKDSKRVQSMLSKSQPKGKTPLSSCIAEIRNEIVQMQPKLEAEGSKVAIVIATDGCNHDVDNIGHDHIDEAQRNEDLKQALESLQGLPVCVVIRLCTDYGPVVDFYNDLDETLEGLDMDVLDDHKAEAEEVYRHNKWLNYSLLLHRMREMGLENRLFDLVDQRPLTRVEIRNFCWLLYGQLDFPDPECEWLDFLRKLDEVQEGERLQLNPRTKKMESWIDVRELALLGATDLSIASCSD